MGLTGAAEAVILGWGWRKRLIALAAGASGALDALSRVDVAAYRATKTKVRGEAAARIRAAIDEEITVEKYRMRARR